MIIEIVGKNVTVTPAMKSWVERKLSALDKYFQISEDTRVRVLARTYSNSQKVEVTIWGKFGTLRAEEVADDFYAAVDVVVDKLEDQIRRQKTKLNRFRRESLADTFVEDDDEHQLPIKEKVIYLDSLSAEEAIMEMDLLGHDFFAYLDEDTKEVCIVYRRNDGDYGVIETRK